MEYPAGIVIFLSDDQFRPPLRRAAATQSQKEITPFSLARCDLIHEFGVLQIAIENAWKASVFNQQRPVFEHNVMQSATFLKKQFRY